MNITIPFRKQSPFFLTFEEGQRIRNVILENIDTSFRIYINDQTGLHISNVTSQLNGKRALSIETLERILSGTHIEVEQCTLNFTLENVTGNLAPIADSPTLEEMLPSLDQIDWVEETDQTVEEASLAHPLQGLQDYLQKMFPDKTLPSSESEKQQPSLETLLESRSWETIDESSDSSSTE